RHTRWPRDWSSDVCSSDLFHHALLDFRELRGFCGKFSEALLHALDRPKQVHRGGSRFSKRVANFLELRPKRVDGFRGRMQDTERRTHRRRHSNRRRSTDHHCVNRLRHLAVVRIGVSNLLGGKPPLEITYTYTDYREVAKAIHEMVIRDRKSTR